MSLGTQLSEVQVVNMALSHLHAPKINAIGEATPQGEAAALFYYSDRDAFVQEARWTFARKSVTLQSISYPDNNWAYAYLYPADCLNIDQLRIPELTLTSPANPSVTGAYPSGTTNWDKRNVPHEICQIEINGKPTGQQAILCNLDAAILVYTRQITDPNQWPATFLKAFALYLALDLGGELNTIPSVMQEVEKKFARACPTAKRVSANEVTDNGDSRSSFERNRRGGRPGGYFSHG